MQGYNGSRRLVRLGAGMLAGAALGAATGAAAGDHPGAAWSVTLVEVEVDPALAGGVDEQDLTLRVGGALRQANEIYFYGTLPVSMRATVRGEQAAPVADVVISDRLSGAVVARVDGLALAEGQVLDTALAWMDGLACPAHGCAGASSTASATELARAPSSASDARSDEAIVPTASVSSPATKSESDAEDLTLALAVPMPRPRGDSGARLGDPDLIGTLIGRSVPHPSGQALERVRLARFNTAGLTDISYSDADRLVLSETAPRALERPVDRPLSSSRRSNPATDDTLIERVFGSFLRLVGIGDAERPGEAVTTRQRRETGQRVPAREAVAAAEAPFRPSGRWASVPVPERSAPDGGDERFAALSILGNGAVPIATERSTITKPAVRDVQAPSYLAPSDGGDPDRPVRPPTFEAIEPRAQRPSSLSVRLHPELFGRYSAQKAVSLLGRRAAPEPRFTVANGGAVPTGDIEAAIETVLAGRGLAMDASTYSRVERVFWNGEATASGYVLITPEALGFKYAMVASNNGSVVARIRTAPGSVRLSAGVAEALQLRPGTWSNVQIIALRETETQATAEPTGRVFRSARITSQN